MLQLHGSDTVLVLRLSMIDWLAVAMACVLIWSSLVGPKEKEGIDKAEVVKSGRKGYNGRGGNREEGCDGKEEDKDGCKARGGDKEEGCKARGGDKEEGCKARGGDKEEGFKARGGDKEEGCKARGGDKEEGCKARGGDKEEGCKARGGDKEEGCKAKEGDKEESIMEGGIRREVGRRKRGMGGGGGIGRS